jgi:hypothetical protein
MFGAVFKHSGKIDDAIARLNVGRDSGREYGILVYGNRLISALVFSTLSKLNFDDPNFDFDTSITDEIIQKKVGDAFNKLTHAVNENYSGAILATLFKNLTKCKYLINECEQ